MCNCEQSWVMSAALGSLLQAEVKPLFADEPYRCSQVSGPSPLPIPSQIGVDSRGVHPKRAPSTRDFRVDGQRSSQIGVDLRA